MSTLSLNPSFAAQLYALVGTAIDFVRAVKAPVAKVATVKAPAQAVAVADVDTTDVWALYRMHRGADAVSPAVTRRLAAIAAAK